MRSLVLIPARGGSKGIPKKNIRPFLGKPLIYYSIDVARNFFHDEDICVSTDDPEIKRVVEAYNLKVPFTRPASFAGDQAGMYEVILHALEIFSNNGRQYDAVILLQPTSPLRTAESLKKAIDLYRDDIDMVVSVKKTNSNPYFKLYEEMDGFLVKCKEGNFKTRQEVPDVWELNGAIYIYNVNSLKKSPPSAFGKIVKFVMTEKESVDIDTEIDWILAELLAKHQSI